MKVISWSDLKRFLNLVSIQKDKTKCWEIHLRPDSSGYVQICIKGKMVLAHRLAWKIDQNKKVPKGYHVLHSCDNPKCVNPNHLFLGTHTDNMKDMAKKGRRKNINTGENNGRSKINYPIACKIRRLHAKGVERKRLSKKFRVSLSTIDGVVKYERWTEP